MTLFPCLCTISPTYMYMWAMLRHTRKDGQCLSWEASKVTLFFKDSISLTGLVLIGLKNETQGLCICHQLWGLRDLAGVMRLSVDYKDS